MELPNLYLTKLYNSCNIVNMRIATEHEMRGIIVWCPVLKKLVTINVYSLNEYEYKRAEFEFKCECGQYHTIEN